MRTRLLIATLLVALVAGACGDDGVLDGTPSPGNGDIPSLDNDGGFTGVADDCLSLVFAWSEAATLGFTADGSFSDAADAVRNLAATAPAEIAGDLAIYAQALQEYGETLDAAGIVLSDPTTYSTPEAQQIATEASEAFNSDEVEAAGLRITDYLETACGAE